MEVLSPQNQSSNDWHSSLDESWDSRLPTPLALDFSVGEEEQFTPYTNGYRDSPTSPDSNHEVQTANTQYLQMARRGGGHSDLLKSEPHTPTSERVKYNKKDGQWYTHNGVDVQDTQQRKEMVTVPNTPRSTNQDSSVDIELETDYLKKAKRGGGHEDLLTLEPHTPTPEPVKYIKKDGQWYTHDGVDIQDTQQRKEMVTVTIASLSPKQNSSVYIELETDYLKKAKRGGGHEDLLIVDPHMPTPEPVTYNKKDGKWYTHDGVDVKETQQRRDLSLDLNGNNECTTAAGGKCTAYLDLAKRGGGHQDMLMVKDHSPSPEPTKYQKKGGEWYNQDDMVIKDGPQESGGVKKRRRTYSDSVSESKAETEYLKTAMLGGGHKDLLTTEPHVPAPEQVQYDKKDGLWYTHDGVDVKDTQGRKGMVTLPNSPRPSSATNTVVDIETETNYLKLAKNGGGHEGLLTADPHTPTVKPVTYDKKDGQWYTHDGVDVKETQQRLDLSASINSCQQDDTIAAGENSGEYLKLAKRGGGHDDLLTLKPHTPAAEPVTYDKMDGQWYTHDGVDVKDTQQRKEMVTVASSPRPSNLDSSMEVKTDTDYLKLAKRGGGHSDLLTADPHTLTPEPVAYDKKDGQWYTHDGVDVKETQQRRESGVSIDSPTCSDSAVAAGGNNTDYLHLAKKGGGHDDLLTVTPHTRTPEPVKYDRTDGQWYTHDGVDIKETQRRKDMSFTLESIPEDATAAGENHGEYLQVARKGGRKDLLTVKPHTPTPEPVKYDKADGQWYTHDGVDVKETQSRKEMVTVASSPRPSSAVDVETDTDYLKRAKKGGGYKDLLTVEPHTPTPEPVKYDKKDGQWYTHDGVDVKDTQSRKEMVTVSSSPRSPNTACSTDAPTETDYLKIAKKGGGHERLLEIEPHTPRGEPVKFDKKDGLWYTHDGVDVNDTQQRKEMATVPSNSPRPSTLGTSGKITTDTDYLKLAKNGGGRKDLLTSEPHTPSPEPQKYHKNGGDWYTQDNNKTKASVPPSPHQSNSTDTEYLKLARQGGGHSDLLTVTPHTPTPESVKYDRTDGQWYTHDGVDVKDKQQKRGTPTRGPTRIPRKNMRLSKFDVNTNTEYLKTARKGGGLKDLLSMEPHTPSPEPRKYEKKGGDWYSQDNVDGDKSKGRKVSPASSSPRQINTETEYLKKARRGGGDKDILTMQHHKPSPKPNKEDDTSQRKESPSPSSSPRKYTSDSPQSTEYLQMARRGGSRKDLLMMTPQSASPKPKEVKRNGDTTPVSSPRNSNSKEPTDYLRLARKGGRNTDLTNNSPAVDTFNTMETPRRKDPNTQDSPLRRSASMRVTSRSAASDYLSTAKRGGHHKDLLTMPENEPSNFHRDQASRRSLRSFRPVITQVDGPPRPKTAEPRQAHPIWLGGSGPERVHSPGKRFINQSSNFAPFAHHDGSPGAAKNPDKI